MICFGFTFALVLLQGDMQEIRSEYLRHKRHHDLLVNQLGDALMYERHDLSRKQAEDLKRLLHEHGIEYRKFESEATTLDVKLGAIQQFTENLETKTAEVLLPHQIKLLHQSVTRDRAMTQQKLGRMGLVLGLSELELTAEEREELEALIRAKQKEFLEEDSELRKKLQQKMLGLLPEKTQDQVNKAFGKLIVTSPMGR